MFSYTGIYHLGMLGLWNLFPGKWIKNIFYFFHNSILCCITYKLLLQTTESVRVENVTLVDNGMAISSMIYMPPAISHKISSKTVQIKVRIECRHTKEKEQL